MQNFNLQQMSGNGYIIIPKLMFAEYMKNCDNHEGDIEAFLKLLMKVNYSETEYTDYWCKKSVCKRGESPAQLPELERCFSLVCQQDVPFHAGFEVERSD